jgi:hypothetical protein
VEQILAYCIAIPFYGLLAIPFILIDKRPERPPPAWKLGISLLLVGAGFTVPLFMPEVLNQLAPLSPLQVWLLCPLVVVPQGFVGAGLACALLWRRPEGQANRDLNHLWWIVSIFGVFWSSGMVVLIGLSFAGWLL